MGRKIVLTGTKLTDTKAPKLVRHDPLEAAGSLFLVDLTHPAAPWAPGVPPSGATASLSTNVPNILAPLAAAALGTTADNVAASFYREHEWESTGSLIERTGKGGIHAVTSPRATGNTGASIAIPAAIKEWIRTHPTNNFYVSVWGRVTRVGTTHQTWAEIAGTSTTSSNYLLIPQVGNSTYAAEGNTWTNTIGPGFGNARNSSWTGTIPSNSGSSAMFGHMASMGHVRGWNFQANAVPGKPGIVYYRVYLEDLTVSGRTFAEVTALDKALYTREVLTAGGRYYGDTFTDPATVV